MTRLFFTIVKDINESGSILNNDLLLISKWACNRKMLFNPHPTKLAQEKIFSKEKEIQTHPIISRKSALSKISMYFTR